MSHFADCSAEAIKRFKLCSVVFNLLGISKLWVSVIIIEFELWSPQHGIFVLSWEKKLCYFTILHLTDQFQSTVGCKVGAATINYFRKRILYCHDMHKLLQANTKKHTRTVSFVSILLISLHIGLSHSCSHSAVYLPFFRVHIWCFTQQW